MNQKDVQRVRNRALKIFLDIANINVDSAIVNPLDQENGSEEDLKENSCKKNQTNWIIEQNTSKAIEQTMSNQI